MRFSTISPESAIDYYDKFGPVFFTRDCNLRCGYCFALKDQGNISSEEFEAAMKNLQVKARAGWYNGATVCGGEPTLQHDLIPFLERLRSIVSVKLDTNGTNPDVLRGVIGRGLVNYVAMDVKAPKERYEEITGVPEFYPDIVESMKILSRFPGHEFRTTFDPRLTTKDIGTIAQEIVEVTKKNDHAYFIQPFMPIKGKIFNEELEKCLQTSNTDLEEACDLAKKHLPNVKIR